MDCPEFHFNATLDHWVMRDLLDDGYSDASAEAGSGINPTWPNGRRLLPMPLFAIDHVLVRDLELHPTSATTHLIPGSDHLALIVHLAGSQRDAT